MRKLILIIFVVSYFTFANAFSKEITNIEWSILNDIQVTVFDSSAYSVSCTAFYIPENNKPIGGGGATFQGNIAQVRIDVPKSYERKSLSDFKITC